MKILLGMVITIKLSQQKNNIPIIMTDDLMCKTNHLSKIFFALQTALSTVLTCDTSIVTPVIIYVISACIQMV